MTDLLTIGYEGCTIDDVLAELRQARVSLLIDVRAVPMSRKPGFSKRQLAAALDEKGIAYLHLQKLGTPTEGREAAKSGDMKTLWRIYAKHLKAEGAKVEMEELVGLVEGGKRVCLLCYERDVAQCHRSKIAEIVQERTGARVTDLVPPLF